MTSTGEQDTLKTVENDCARCGSCTVVCPVYRASGGKEFYSARGRNYLQKIKEDMDTAELQDIFSQCLLCGACSDVCPRGIDCTAHVRVGRGQHPETFSLVRRFGESFGDLLGKKIPAESGLRLRLAMFDDEGITSVSHMACEQPVPSPEESSLSDTVLEKLIYFPGCTALYLTPSLLVTHRELFAFVGYDLVVPDGLGCCGRSTFSTGNFGDAVRRGKQNIEVLERSDGPILVGCASCFSHFHFLAQVFEGQIEWQERAQRLADRCVELSQFLVDRMEHTSAIVPNDSTAKMRVFYHDPCLFRNELKIMAEPRSLLKNIGNIELIELADGPQCCGMGGLFHISSPELSARIRDDLKEKVLAQSPDIVTTTCSDCLMQWKAAIASTKSDIRVMHLSELLYLTLRVT